MEFHVITDKGAVLICTVEGSQVTIPGDSSAVVDSPACTEKSNDCAPLESG